MDINDLKDIIYTHNGQWYYRKTKKESIGPFPDMLKCTEALYQHLLDYEPLMAVMLRVLAQTAADARVHQHKGEPDWHYVDPNDDKCVGPYDSKADALQGLRLRIEQIALEETK